MSTGTGLNVVMSEIIEAKKQTRLGLTITHELTMCGDWNFAFVRSNGFTAHDQS